MMYARNVSRGKIYYCAKCGDEREVKKFKWCIPCRIAGALRHLLYRNEHIKRRLCTECTDGNHYSNKYKRRLRMCLHHRQYHNEWAANKYEISKRKKICVVCHKRKTTRTVVCDKCTAKRKRK